MSKKLRTYRRWKEPYWIQVTYDKIGERLWHIGASIHKSKRAQADWYKARKNKRARSAAQIRVKREYKYLVQLRYLLEETIRRFPKDVQFCIIPEGPRQEALARYAQRLGFIPYRQGDRVIWILTILEN